MFMYLMRLEGMCFVYRRPMEGTHSCCMAALFTTSFNRSVLFGVKLNERKKSEELRELLGLEPVSLIIKKE